jgi:hypothetical protein
MSEHEDAARQAPLTLGREFGSAIAVTRNRQM